jgi:hypothetical protein
MRRCHMAGAPGVGNGAQVCATGARQAWLMRIEFQSREWRTSAQPNGEHTLADMQPAPEGVMRKGRHRGWYVDCALGARAMMAVWTVMMRL